MLLARRKREQGKEAFDATHRTHAEGSFKVGDIVLLHNTILDANMSVKLHFKWMGPYKIRTAIPEKGTYTLEELDGTVRSGTVAGNRLKHLQLRKSDPARTYEAPLQVSNTLSQMDEAVLREEDEDQGTIFLEGGDDPDAMDIDDGPDRSVPYTQQARAR